VLSFVRAEHVEVRTECWSKIFEIVGQILEYVIGKDHSREDAKHVLSEVEGYAKFDK
jgi:hypothetical protein